MANYCFIDLCFEGDEENISQLYKDLKNLKGETLCDLAPKEDFPDKRVWVNYLQDLDEESRQLWFSAEGAWYHHPEVFIAISEKYDLDFELYAEEPGMELYINTDEYGEKFTVNYVIPHDYDYEEDRDDTEEDNLACALTDMSFFDSESEIISHFKLFFNVEFTINEIYDILNRYNLRLIKFQKEL